jgi:putative ABC transport system permease protein
MGSGISVDPDAFASAITFNMSQDDLTSLLMNYLNGDTTSYDGNLDKLGYADAADPESISIYPKDFDSKEVVLDIIDEYNTRAEESGNPDDTIQYTDIMGSLI